MKRIIYTLGIIVAAAFTFSACQKEQAIDGGRPSDKLVTVTFSAEKAGTKTAAVEGTEEVSFIWTDEDVANMKLFIVGEEEGKEKLTFVSNSNITKVSATKLTISANVAPGNYTFRAVMSGKWTSGNNPRLSESQSPELTNFDPTADVLISEDMEVSLVDSGEGTVNTGDRLMVFHRPVVVNKMTLKNLAEGENISKVVITSSKNLAGYFNTKTRIATGDKTSLTLNYTNASVPADGQFPVYFTTIPESGHVLTIEVTTDQNVYTKSFAEGKSIDFNLGQFTKFNFALPEGVANTSISLPIEDSMDWAVNDSGADGNEALSVSSIPVKIDDKKVYSEASYIYKGIDGLKMGSSSNRGVLTTSELDLSSAFYIEVSAKAWSGENGSDVSQVEFLVNGESVFKSANLSNDYKTYVYNASAATAKSKIAIKIDGKRGYIKNLKIKAGAVVLPPVINVTSENPLSVVGTGGIGTINYTIANPTEATLTAAKKDANATWISNIDCSTSGKVTFDVAAQESGAAARSAVIVLSYANADDVEVTVNQERGSSSVSANNWSYTFTSNPWGGISGNADLESRGTTINWNLAAGYASYNNSLLALSSGSVKANASITSNDVVSNVSKVVVNAKTNSSCTVTLTVKVGNTTLGTETLNNVTTLTDYAFTSSTPVSGKISINFTDPTSGYQIKRIDINPASASVTGISVEDYTASFNVSESGSYSFDGKVYAVYSDNSRTLLSSNDYVVSGTVDFTTQGDYLITISATIDGTEYEERLTITVKEAGTTDTFTFTSKSWGDANNAWTSGKDGNQMQSGRGIQITTGASGANATTKSSFTSVSEVVVTYSTNASAGAGSIAIQVGSNTAYSQNVTKTGGTDDRTLTYAINPNETGAVKIAVTCTTNSIYIKSVAITHK